MSWRDSLRPGSWRGSEFLFLEHEGEGGRRGELHEFPFRDTPWFEDLGAKASRFVFEVVVLGADYIAKREQLLAALDLDGPGTLIHPTRGALSLVCETFTWRETTEQGGACFFTLEFVEAGQILPPSPAPDTGDLVASTVDEVVEAAPEDFAEDFSVERMPGWVSDKTVFLVRRLTAAAATAGLLLGGTGSPLRAFEVALGFLPGKIGELVRQPLELGLAVAALVRTVSGIGDRPGARVSALRRLAAEVEAAPPVIGATPSRERERTNQAAFQRLVVALAMAEAVDQVAQIDFASYDEAVALRDSLAGELDAFAVGYADAGDDAAAETIDRLRLVMVRDVTARGGSLERLYRYVPARTEPALVIAHRLYGTPGEVIAQAEDIVARNRIRHPAFVPGGRSLEVRTNG